MIRDPPIEGGWPWILLVTGREVIKQRKGGSSQETCEYFGDF